MDGSKNFMPQYTMRVIIMIIDIIAISQNSMKAQNHEDKMEDFHYHNTLISWYGQCNVWRKC